MYFGENVFYGRKHNVFGRTKVHSSLRSAFVLCVSDIFLFRSLLLVLTFTWTSGGTSIQSACSQIQWETVEDVRIAFSDRMWSCARNLLCFFPFVRQNIFTLKLPYFIFAAEFYFNSIKCDGWTASSNSTAAIIAIVASVRDSSKVCTSKYIHGAMTHIYTRYVNLSKNAISPNVFHFIKHQQHQRQVMQNGRPFLCGVGIFLFIHIIHKHNGDKARTGSASFASGQNVIQYTNANTYYTHKRRN